MADLAGAGTNALQELAIDNDATADPGADGDVNHIPDVHARTESIFPQGGGVSIVVDENVRTELVLKHLLQREGIPAGQIWGR